MKSQLSAIASKLMWSDFSSAQNWETFRLRELGPEVWGYTESVFDGRYVYYGTERTAVGAHGRLLRYDTTKPFDAFTSWELFDASRVIGHGASYIGIACDGRYVYFAPFRGGLKFNVTLEQIVLRYDSRLSFTDPSAWTAFDLSTLHPELGGFVGAKVVRGILYFAPYYSGSRSLFVTYRCDGGFTDPSSWKVFDLMNVDSRAKGYLGVESDGRYIYYGPCYNDVTDQTTTIMVRYDSTREFSMTESWELFDLAQSRQNPSLGGYHGSMTFDGRYVYYSPLYAPKPADIEALHHGWLARFDTQRPFCTPDSWQTFDTRTLDDDVCGYSGAGFDGRYVYYCPVRCCSHLLHGKVLRFDTRGDFGSPDSYRVFDAQSIDPGLAYFDGEIAFDGSHVYFPAASDNAIMLRYQTRTRIGRLAAILGRLFSRAQAKG